MRSTRSADRADAERLLVAYDGYAPDATTVIEFVLGEMEVLKADFTTNQA